MTRTGTRLAALVLCATFAATTPAVAQAGARSRGAQGPPPASPAQDADRSPRADDENARETHSRLMNLLRQYPPSLSEVLRLDPSLLTNDAYLAPYPALAAFLKQHPEVAHNPGYFVGEVRFSPDDTNMSLRKLNMVESTLAGFAVLCGFITFMTVVGLIAKAIIDHRRWLRLSKVQAEVHTKLLDRFTSNEELLAYIQTPVGRRFLESAPIQVHDEARPLGAPLSRILLSLQAGVVLAIAGLGVLLVSLRFSDEPAQFFFVVGIVTMALGAGFIVSAGAAYGLSRKLGLLERPAADNA